MAPLSRGPTRALAVLLLGLAGCAADVGPPHQRLAPHYRAQQPAGPGQATVRRMGSGLPVTVRLYPEARHSFDVSDLLPVQEARSFPGRTVGHHPEVARQAWAETLAFFERELRRAR